MLAGVSIRVTDDSIGNRLEKFPRVNGLMAYVVLVLVVTAAYFGAVSDIAAYWNNSFIYAHGTLLALVLVVQTALESKDETAFDSPNSFVSNAAVLVLGCALLGASMVGFLFAQIGLSLFLHASLVNALFGWRFAIRFWPIYAGFISTLPMWDNLAVPLQKLAVIVTNETLQTFGRTALVEGNNVYLGSGTFLVARGCAGVNFVLAAIALSGVIAYWFAEKTLPRLIIIVSSGLLAIVGNWMRIILIVLAGDLSDMQHSLVEDHIWFGWVTFGVALSPVIAAAVYAQKEHVRHRAGSETVWANGRFAHTARAVILMLLVIAPSVSVWAVVKANGSPEEPGIVVAAQIDRYRLLSEPAGLISPPQFPDAGASRNLVYSDGKDRYQLQVFAYDLRDRNAELVGHPNLWFEPESRAEINWPGRRRWEYAGTVFGPTRLIISSKTERQVRVGGYLIGGRFTGHAVEASVHAVLSELIRDNVAAAVVASSNCVSSCSDSLAGLDEFLRQVIESDAIKLHTSQSSVSAQ